MSSIEQIEYEKIKAELDYGWPWPLSSVQQWFEGMWNAVSRWVYDAAKQVWSWLPSWIQSALGFLRDLAVNAGAAVWAFFKNPIGAIQGGLNWVVSGVRTMFDGAVGFIGAKVSDILNGIAGALGQGLQWVVDWLITHLGWLAQMIWGAINAVVSWISGAVNALVRGFLSAVTAGMSGHSPEPQLAKTMQVMIQSTWERQIEIIKGAHHSPANPGDVSAAAIGIAAALGVAGVGSVALGIASDAAHPFKDLGAREAASDIVGWVGIPSVLHSIMTLPSAVGLLTPLRYELFSLFTPMQPGAQDIVRFAVRECFDANRLKTLLEAYPGESYSNALAREGFSSQWAQMYWGAHWVLPDIGQLNEYLYRHDDFLATWRKYARYLDLIPEAIPWLEETIHPPFTRVDIRRMWNMRIVDEQEVYTNYRWLGYDDKHAQALTLWTKVEDAFPELIAQYSNGWLSIDDVFTQLALLGLSEERATELLETKIKAVQPTRVAKERELTKAEIVKGVKVGVINAVSAVDLLMDMGYDEDEAWYILAINKVVEAGDPEGYWEMKKVTQAYRAAQGKSFKRIPDELVMLDELEHGLTRELEQLKIESASAEDLAAVEAKLSLCRYRRNALMEGAQL